MQFCLFVPELQIPIISFSFSIAALMAKFLNTEKITHWIAEIINTSESELIIIVPYIKTSSKVFDSLYLANQKGVDITLIYREDKLDHSEKSKLLSLQNLNLLHHPNIHAKCYFNGELLLICSMNLYEFSEKNNREMGVLLHQKDIDEKKGFGFDRDDETEFINAKKEIREIITGSSPERVNSRKHNNSFQLENLKSKKELAQESCNHRNKFFLNKKFETVKIREDNYAECCQNYYDHVNVSVEGHRIAFDFNHPDIDLQKLHDNWMSSYNEYEFKDFKYYWSYYKSSLYLYTDKRFDWEQLKNQSEANFYQKIKEGIEYIIQKYRDVSGK